MRYKGLIALVVVSIALAGTSWAQKRKPGQVKTYKRKKITKRVTDPNAPQFKREKTERRYKRLAEQALEAQIQTLDQLLQVTEDTDKQKPTMLYKLADLYWEKSQGYFLKAFGLDEKIFQAKKRGQSDLAARMLKDKAKFKKLSTEWRHKVITVFQRIEKNHPTFKDLDAVFYYCGFHYAQMGLADKGYKYFLKLVRQRPKSRLVPEALLSIGEYYFQNRNLDMAEAFYKRVQLYPHSKAFGFALYKHAWVHYNRKSWVNALKKFLQVIKYADTKTVLRKKHRLSLRRESVRDLVKTYAQVGSAEKALPFFKRIAPKIYLELGQMLANNYQDNGEHDKAVTLLKLLIAEAPRSHKILRWQLRIVNNVDRLPSAQERTVREVGRMVALYKARKDTAPPDFLKSLEKEMDETMRVIATHYHKIAESTKNEKLLAYAHHMYKEYFKIFKASPELTAMTMNYANMLYNLNKWKMAALMYEKVLESDANGKYADDAAFFVLMCYNRLISVSNELSKNKTDLTKKKKLPELMKQMVNACDRYVDVAAKNPKKAKKEDVIKAKFAAAKIYADHGHINEAMRRFSLLRTEHQAHYLSQFATKYLVFLATIAGKNKILKDIMEGNQQNLSPEVKNTLNKIRKKNQFNSCFDLEEKKRYTSAGDCFRKYTRKFPDAKDLDQALYKAAQNYQRSKQIQAAIESLGELYNKRNKSKLAPDALFSIGRLYHATAVYSEAAKFYELFVQNHSSKKKLAETAIISAALFRQGLNQYDKAIANYKRFLELFKTSKQVFKVYYNIGKIFEKQKKWRDSIDHFQRYLKLYKDRGSLDMRVGATFKIAWGLWKQGKKRKALKAFKETTKLWKRLSASQKKNMTFGRTHAAHARFMEGEFLMQEAEKVKLKLPQRRLKKLFKKKGTIIADAQKVFVEVRGYKDPNWTIAAICRIGLAYQKFGTAIEQAPVPKGLNEIQVDAYKTFLDGVGEKIKKNAIRYYKGCLLLAQKLSWFNQFTNEAEINLTKLDYSLKVMKELRPSPGFVLTKNRLSDFDTTLPD